MISVCMATYNGEKFIREQIESILVQLGTDDELVISDDSSTDGTLSLVESLSDQRIRLFKDNLFRDPIKNFQFCLQQARGDIIFLSDQDDVWLPGKYNKMKVLLQEYDLVISDAVITDEALVTLYPSFYRFFGSGKGVFKNIIRSSYYGSSMAFSRHVLNLALPFPATREIGHDLWIGLVAELTGRVCFFNEPLLLYRRHGNAFTQTGLAKSKRSIFRMMVGRIIMLKEICIFLIRWKWKKD